MKTGIIVVVCIGLVAGAFAGQYLIEFAGNPGGRNTEMAGVGKKPAVGYGKQKETGQVGYVDADGYAQPDPTADKKTKLAQSLETALTGGYSADDYKKNPQPAPSFDYSDTTPQPKRDAWVDGQKPSAYKEKSKTYSDDSYDDSITKHNSSYHNLGTQSKADKEAIAAGEARIAKQDKAAADKQKAALKEAMDHIYEKDYTWDGKDKGVEFADYFQKKYHKTAAEVILSSK